MSVREAARAAILAVGGGSDHSTTQASSSAFPSVPVGPIAAYSPYGTTTATTTTTTTTTTSNIVSPSLQTSGAAVPVLPVGSTTTAGAARARSYSKGPNANDEALSMMRKSLEEKSRKLAAMEAEQKKAKAAAEATASSSSDEVKKLLKMLEEQQKQLQQLVTLHLSRHSFDPAFSVAFNQYSLLVAGRGANMYLQTHTQTHIHTYMRRRLRNRQWKRLLVVSKR